MIASLLFIIFGRKVREKDYGPSYPINCPRCDNEAYYHAYKWRSWFHIFWIPLIPWFSHKHLMCPICQHGIELERDEFKLAKALAGDTEKYGEQQLSEADYLDSLRDFEMGVSFLESADTRDPDSKTPS